MMQTMASDIAPVQRGTSVQLYHKALTMLDNDIHKPITNAR